MMGIGMLLFRIWRKMSWEGNDDGGGEGGGFGSTLVFCKRVFKKDMDGR